MSQSFTLTAEETAALTESLFEGAPVSLTPSSNVSSIRSSSAQASIMENQFTIADGNRFWEHLGQLVEPYTARVQEMVADHPNEAPDPEHFLWLTTGRQQGAGDGCHKFLVALQTCSVPVRDALLTKAQRLGLIMSRVNQDWMNSMRATRRGTWIGREYAQRVRKNIGTGTPQ